MSTPYTSQKLDLNPSYCKFGAQILLDLLNGFNQNIGGVIENKDVECVHKTRVISRRLRAALPLFRFCFPAKKFDKWTKEIKKVTQRLGNARDLDVQIAFIEEYLKKNPLEKAGIDSILKDHQELRESLQPLVVKELNKLLSSDILDDISSFCKDLIEQQAAATFDANQVLEKSHWHASFRLDEFLSLQRYVHLPNENLKHHEMRIAAKRLRYTMEFFAPLYKSQLKEEIETIKKYQDILGEKHDNEVWLDYIPKFIEKTVAKNKTDPKQTAFKSAVNKFQTYVKTQRQQHYKEFVGLWDQNQQSGFFDRLRDATKAGTTLSEKKIQQTLTNPHAAIAVISDVHANLQALQRVFEDAEERGVTVFLNAGDSVGYGANPSEVVACLCEKNVLSVVGNYDLEVLEGKSKPKGEKKLALKYTQKQLSKACASYLNSLPREIHLEVGDKKLFVTHGSPESIEEHLYHDTPIERLKILAEDAKAEVIIVGHSHEQFQREADKTWFVNPGSVGRPDDGDPKAAYAILWFDPFKVELIRLSYDVDAAAQALREGGLPESYSQMLLRGVSIDTVNKEDQTNQEATDKNCKQTLAAAEEFSKQHWPDCEHYKQVTKLALQFFDGLGKLHKFGSRERCWLECASLLHDVGLAQARGAHHKTTAQLILNDTTLPFTSKDRRVIASIARYHRKGLPKPSHYNLLGLDKETVHKIEVLASFLRLADGLDYTHEANVESLSFRVGVKRVTVEGTAKMKSVLEEQAFNKKKDLFEKVFNTLLVLRWKQK
ncbi:MAG: YfcE family phosphodiesterase [Candidatus Bathyarchaeota archaeon]|nr:YfcE family phosphodiesterase [Candidatus Bathyarchaeota archaeon]